MWIFTKRLWHCWLVSHSSCALWCYSKFITILLIIVRVLVIFESRICCLWSRQSFIGLTFILLKLLLLLIVALIVIIEERKCLEILWKLIYYGFLCPQLFLWTAVYVKLLLLLNFILKRNAFCRLLFRLLFTNLLECW